ncbi:unnamed protein product, partial [marine sediment metagenome]
LRNKTKERIIKLLESMPFEEARSKILHVDLGFDENSLSQNFCLSWLKHKESSRRDKRESLTLRIAIWASIIAIVAIIVANKDELFRIIFTIINYR